ncbi:MAG TPA: DNA-3-methyladenine glycosylase 2, partial [Candidatus Obscuribacter sp.]|nr:DNA-3-methyladenine glycosylase 2 [Candidatus Obscuribacter sp.]
PGNSIVDSRSRLITDALSRIEDNALAADSLEEFASELGVSSRHLRRVFESEIGVSPVEYIQTQRLLAAKRLLTDTNMAVTQIALASGFGSVRRFNALFQERYRLSPSELRKSRSGELAGQSDTFTCSLTYRPPYDWESILAFLRLRACPGIENVTDTAYSRTVSIDGTNGWLTVEQSPKTSCLTVTLSSSLAPKFLQVVNRLNRLFDLQAKPDLIETQLGKLARDFPGLRVPGAFDPFEVSIRGILGQQVSVKAATNLAGRLAKKYGAKIDTPIDELTLLSPTAGKLSKATTEGISELGIVSTRANTIINFAKAYEKGELKLYPGADFDETVKALTSLPGIGEWTADYIAMRCLAWPDAFPHGDLGIKKALNKNHKKEILAIAESYRPWRAYAAMHLWKSLDKLAPKAGSKGKKKLPS